MYLPAGQACAEQFVFFRRATTYSAWMAGFYLATGKDLRSTYYVEKLSTLVLLAVAVAMLTTRLTHGLLGLAAGLWILNSKYLVLETNGSHAFAALLCTGAALSLTLPTQAARLPLGLVWLAAASQSRTEVALVLVVFSFLGVCHWLVHKDRLWPRDGNRSSVSRWVASGLILLAVGALVILRRGPAEPGRLREAVMINFCLNYLDRTGTITGRGEPDFPTIWEKAFRGSGVTALEIRRDPRQIRPAHAFLARPEEMAAHITWNLRLLARAIPAVLTAPWHYTVAAVVLGLIAVSLSWPGEPLGGHPVVDERQYTLLGRLAASLVLVLVALTVVLRPVARYYIPILPVFVVGSLVTAHRLRSLRMATRPPGEGTRRAGAAADTPAPC